ncbi:MAG: heat-inducible transcriptional repressor HrcA [Ruminiclostridium sp.]|nr:heat-inducible transcriptional repressor HrcA [Ruminiclostridium sp.]
MEKRAYKILETIVDEYIRTGEPIGSKAVMELLDIKVSSATIRNEMASLEQQGLLEHPHTSAGRVPTYKGLRLYISRLAEKQIPETDRIAIDRLFEEMEGMTDEVIIENAARALADFTKCAIVSANDTDKFSVITKVEVIPTGRRMYVLMMMTSGGGIKNRVCRLSFDLTHEQMDFFRSFVSENLQGVNLREVSDSFMDDLTAALGSYMLSLSPLLKGIADLSADMINERVRIEGEENLIECGELKGNEIANVLRRKEALTAAFDKTFSGINVLFGEENNTFVISNSSMITGTFSKDGENAGGFGVIGPMRLEYKKIIPYIEYFTDKVSDLLSRDADGSEGDDTDEIKEEEKDE